jgi:hypothetical protein
MGQRLFSPVVFVDTLGSHESLAQLLDKALTVGAQSLLVLACDANGFTPAQLDHDLCALPVPVFGGIFPEIVADGQRLRRGCIVCALPMPVEVFTIKGLSDHDQDFYDQTAKLAGNIRKGSTLAVLVDGLGKRISALLESLYEALGVSCRYVGGGAGSLSFVQKPCLFSNQGLLEDCAQIVAIDLPVGIGIEHGWHKFAGPFFVTGAFDNTITTLDYRPAFEVYREVVEADSGKSFSDSSFFDLAKAYPFGMERLKSDVLVRDPLFTVEGKLVCVGEVPVNNIVYILKGSAENLLAASSHCAGSALQGQTALPLFALLFDCISRTLFLQERFAEEIDNIRAGLPAGVPLVGALSLGEIADAGNVCLEFLNKTIVLGVLGDSQETAA